MLISSLKAQSSTQECQHECDDQGTCDLRKAFVSLSPARIPRLELLGTSLDLVVLGTKAIMMPPTKASENSFRGSLGAQSAE